MFEPDGSYDNFWVYFSYPENSPEISFVLYRDGAVIPMIFTDGNCYWTLTTPASPPTSARKPVSRQED